MNWTRAEAGIHGRYLPSSQQCAFVYLFFQNMPAPDHVNVVSDKLKSCDLLLDSIRLFVSIVVVTGLLHP